MAQTGVDTSTLARTNTVTALGTVPTTLGAASTLGTPDAIAGTINPLDIIVGRIALETTPDKDADVTQTTTAVAVPRTLTTDTTIGSVIVVTAIIAITQPSPLQSL